MARIEVFLQLKQDTSLCSFMFLKLTSKEEEMIGWRAAWTEALQQSATTP